MRIENCNHEYVMDTDGDSLYCANCGLLKTTIESVYEKKDSPMGPMGVSQWEKHGRKYGYWEYFKNKINENS